jgi:amidase
MGSHSGMDAILGSLGPMTRSARDLALFSKVMLDAKPWFVEPQILEIPWRPDLVDGHSTDGKLSIAILWDDGVVRPHPPIVNALKQVNNALIDAGHDVIHWEPMDNHQASWNLITKLYFQDGADEYIQLMRDTHDPPVPQTEWILSFAPNRPYTVPETWELNVQRDAFRTELAAHWLATKHRTKTGRPVDVVLCPVAPTLAPPHDTTRWWGYSSYWNLADYPGVVFPVGRHSSTSVYDDVGSNPRNDVEDSIQKQWNPETYHNAPISLQLVARRLNEEKLLHALNVVEDAMKRSHAQMLM